MDISQSIAEKSLLTDAESLLSEIAAYDAVTDTEEEEALFVSEEAIKAAMDEVAAPAGPQLDGFVEISASGSNLIAKGNFHPPAIGKKAIDIKDIQRMLKELNIIHGVDWEGIGQAINRCNAELVYIGDLTIAKASLPQNEVPPYLIIEANLLDGNTVTTPNDKQIDHHDLSAFKLVKKNDILARAVPKAPGIAGHNIKGPALAYKVENKDSPTLGKNTLWEKGVVIATCDGRFIASAKEISVNEVLFIHGDVDYSTGNIQFPGDVHIAGGIINGFKVISGGSIYCTKLMDATIVEATGDIVTGLGIIGRKVGLAKAGGSITAKFIEHCFVEAAGKIRTNLSCLNSVIQTQDKFETGPTGIVSGGKIYAKNGLNVAQIGTASGPKTEIICGVDYTVQRKLMWIRDKNIALAMSLQEIERTLTAETKESQRIQSICARIKESIHKLNEIALVLVNNLDKNDGAQIIVRGKIFPPTYIEICHASFVVSKVMTYQRIYLDKSRGRIVSENLS